MLQPGSQAALSAPLDHRVTASFEQTPLSKVAEKLAQVAAVEIIVEPQVAGKKVTVALADVPVRDALERIASRCGLELRDQSRGEERVLVFSSGRPYVEILCGGMSRVFLLAHVSPSAAKEYLGTIGELGPMVSVEIDDAASRLEVYGTHTAIQHIAALLVEFDEPDVERLRP